MRYFTPIRLTKIKTLYNVKCWWNSEAEPAGGSIIWFTTLLSKLAINRKINICLLLRYALEQLLHVGPERYAQVCS